MDIKKCRTTFCLNNKITKYKAVYDPVTKTWKSISIH